MIHWAWTITAFLFGVSLMMGATIHILRESCQTLGRANELLAMGQEPEPADNPPEE